MFEKTQTWMEKAADILYNPISYSTTENVISNGINSISDADHKRHILETRRGGFGSSDAGMLVDIALTGRVMPKYYERLGVFAGVLEPKSFSNKYTETGNQREREIFEYLQKENPEKEWWHNPIYNDIDGVFSNEYRCFSHIDITENWVMPETGNVLVPGGTQTNIYEIKTSQDSTDTILERYDSQLKWHCVLAKNRVINVLHYQENWSEVSETGDAPVFDATKIKHKILGFLDEDLQQFIEKIRDGLAVITEFLTSQKADGYKEILEHCKEKTMVTIYENELSKSVIKKMRACSNFMKMSKAHEDEQKQIKEVILKLMTAKNIDKWKFEDIVFTKVGEGFSVSLDTKKIKEEAPEIYKKYSKESKRKAYLKMEIKEGESNGN